MKVAMVNPVMPDIYSGAHPVSLSILAAYIRQFGHEVKIIDLASGANYPVELEKFKPEIVAITGTTPTIQMTYRCANYARSKGYKVVIGGVHASVMPHEAIQYADVVVVGEGEIALKQIIENNLTGIIQGTPYENIEELPLPAYDLLNMEFYVHNKMPKIITCANENNRMANILTSRGCPYNCTFCHNSFKGLKFRWNSPEKVIEEIEYLIKNYNIDTLFFIEDNFFVNDKRAREICQLMIDRGIKLMWGANARVDNLNVETLKLAKKAGCKQITFGWESGSQKMLDKYNKKATVQQNIDSIRICNEVGIYPNGTVMIGGPDEDLEDVRMTQDFILKNDILGNVGVCTVTPFPGTELWKQCVEKGLIDGNFNNWTGFDFTNSPVKMHNIPIDKFYQARKNLMDIAAIRTYQCKLSEEIEKLLI